MCPIEDGTLQDKIIFMMHWSQLFPTVSDFPGTLYRIDPFPSSNIPPRKVDFWLPAGYDPTRRYPVLYMHDGKNLFNPAEAYLGRTWGVAETLNQMGIDCLVVGVWSAGENRVPEYMPEAPFTGAQFDGMRAGRCKDLHLAPYSDAYLRFLVEELKPWVDANLATQTDPAHTLIMGSSMGGLVSMYALCRYPQVFGSAGCLSTHWPIGAGQIEEWMRDHLPQPGSHRLYFDYGGHSLDRDYSIHNMRVHGFLIEAGWREGIDYLLREFPRATHSAHSWRRRLTIPLEFLFNRNY